MAKEKITTRRRIAPAVWMLGLLAAGLLATFGVRAAVKHHRRAIALRGVTAKPDLRRCPKEFADRVDIEFTDIHQSTDAVPPLADLARLYHVNGFNAEATAALRALNRLDSRNPRWPYYLADLRLKARDPAEARTLLARVAELAPNYLPVHRQLAELLAQAGETKSAAEHRRRVEQGGGDAALDPWITELGEFCYDSYRLQLLAEAQFRANRPADGLPFLVRAAQLSPDEPLFRDMLATAYKSMGRFAEARAALEDGIRAIPTAFSLPVRLAALLCEQSRAPEAVAVMRRAALQWPEQPEVLAALGHTLLIAKQPMEAVTAFESALRRNDRLTEAHFNLGNAQLQLGRRADARASYARACELRPDFMEAVTALTNLALEDGDLDAAEKCAAAAYKVSGEPGTARRLYARVKSAVGVSAMRAGKFAEAERAFAAGVQIDPGLGSVYAGLGRAQAAMGRLDEAIATFRRYAELAPRETDAYLMLAHALLEAKQVAEAKRVLTQGADLARQQGNSQRAQEFERLLRD